MAIAFADGTSSAELAVSAGRDHAVSFTVVLEGSLSPSLTDYYIRGCGLPRDDVLVVEVPVHEACVGVQGEHLFPALLVAHEERVRELRVRLGERVESVASDVA